MHSHCVTHPNTNTGSGASVPLQPLAAMSSHSAANKDDATGSELGVESIGSVMEPGDAAAASPGDLAFALRTVAEALKAQQKMQEKLCEKITERPDRARVLASVKLPDFDGHQKCFQF